MNSTMLHAKVLPALLGGTSRHPLLGDHPLEMLSLMGQALRFERPSTPDSFVVEPEAKDDRKILADPLRRPLLRVLTAKNATDHPARALARAFDRLRLRPHPFDLPFIETFVRSNTEKLGPTAQHWAARQRPDAATQSFFDPELLDENNWAQATPSRRVAYLEQRRRDDVDAARALVESRWDEQERDAEPQTSTSGAGARKGSKGADIRQTTSDSTTLEGSQTRREDISKEQAGKRKQGRGEDIEHRKEQTA